jgi:cytidine deaminase
MHPSEVNVDLIAAARTARDRAYAPYSSFQVGAALRSLDGQVFSGCNVENVSYGLTICAERAAIGAAVTQGVREFSDLALIADSKEPIVPCGACRQVLAEFSPNVRIISSTLEGETAVFTLDKLFPLPAQGILG